MFYLIHSNDNSYSMFHTAFNSINCQFTQHPSNRVPLWDWQAIHTLIQYPSKWTSTSVDLQFTQHSANSVPVNLLTRQFIQDAAFISVPFTSADLQVTQHSSNTVPLNSLTKQFIQHLSVFLLLQSTYTSHNILQTLFHYLTYSNSHPSQRTNQGTSPLKDTVTGSSAFHAGMYSQLLHAIQAGLCFLTSSFQNKLVIGL